MVELATESITTEGVEIMVSIETEGVPEGLAEKVHMATQDAAARALQAVAEKKHPDKCDGIGITIDWDGVIKNQYGDYGEVPADD